MGLEIIILFPHVQLSSVLQVPTEDSLPSYIMSCATPPSIPALSHDLSRSNPHEREFEENDRNPFQTATTSFDDPTDLDYVNVHDHSKQSYNQRPQKYQLRTGSRRGPHERARSASQDSLDGLSKLSIIPEETPTDMQLVESHDSTQRSGDSPQRSRDASGNEIGKPSSSREISSQSSEVPWYDEETSSHDLWQTTPAYHREEVCSLDRKSHFQEIFVTEEIVPVLQVSWNLAPYVDYIPIL